MGLLVRATKEGYYGDQRRHAGGENGEPGDQFEIAGPEDYSPNWMILVDAEGKPASDKEFDKVMKARTDYAKKKRKEYLESGGAVTSPYQRQDKNPTGPAKTKKAATAAQKKAAEEEGEKGEGKDGDDDFLE